jgi:hypothetical protein
MQPLEKPKDSLLVVGIDTNAVIADGKNPVSILALGSDVHHRRSSVASVFYGISDEVLEQLLQMRAMHLQRGQRIGGYSRAAFRN